MYHSNTNDSLQHINKQIPSFGGSHLQSSAEIMTRTTHYSIQDSSSLADVQLKSPLNGKEFERMGGRLDETGNELEEGSTLIQNGSQGGGGQGNSSSRHDSLLLTFSGNAFPSSEFLTDSNFRISIKRETSLRNNLPSPPTSLNSKGNSYESPMNPVKRFIFPGSESLRMKLPVKVKPTLRVDSPSLSNCQKKGNSGYLKRFQVNDPQFNSTLTEKFILNKTSMEQELYNVGKVGKILNFEESNEEALDFNEFLQDSNQETSPDILQRLLAENEQLKEKTKNNEEMVQKLLGCFFSFIVEIIEDRYKNDFDLKDKVAAVTNSPAFFAESKFSTSKTPKLQININQLLSMKKANFDTSILKVTSNNKPRIHSNKGPRVASLRSEIGMPRSAEGRIDEEEMNKLNQLNSTKNMIFSTKKFKFDDFSSFRAVPNLESSANERKKEPLKTTLPRIPTSSTRLPCPNVNDIFSFGKGPAVQSLPYPRKNYKFQTLNPRINGQPLSPTRQESLDSELRSTKGKFPKELFSKVSKKKFVI